MILYPALDLRNGFCVRLRVAPLDGERSAAHVEKIDALAQSDALAALGFKWIHIADLDGAAREAKPTANLDTVMSIVRGKKLSVQFAGGVRDVQTVEKLLGHGIERVVIDASAIKDPFIIKDSCRLFPGRIIVELAADNRIAMAGGWMGQRDVRVLDLALMFEDYGVASFIYSEVNEEGGMGGINVEAIADLAFALTTPVIASGGLSSLADIQALKAEEETGIAGIICGRALHDSRIDPVEALKIASAPYIPVPLNT